MKELEWKTVGKRTALGALGAACAAVLAACLGGVLVQREALTIQAAALLVRVCASAALFGLCFSAARAVPKSRLPVALLTAGLYALLCLLGKAVLFSGAALGGGWWNLLPLAAAVAAGLLASRRKTVKRR